MSTDTKVCVRSVHGGGVDISVPDPHDAAYNQTVTCSWEQVADLYADLERTMRKYGKLPGLPRDEDGFVQTSASYGDLWHVRITYYTDFDGRKVDPGKEELPETFHGPFETQEEAVEWVEAYPDGDTDIEDIVVGVLNKVRP